jgi:predicted component of type VI protein secretion system
METAHGFAAPAVSALARGIREYSLFQAVLLVMDRLRQEYPGLGDEALYDQLEFQANPSLGFPGSDVDRVEFFEERGMLRARLRFNMIGLFGASSPLPRSTASRLWATARRAILRGTSSISSITACIGCCCRSGASTATG